MLDDYGKKVGVALRAVEQMHSDCSKLLIELDRRMQGWRSLYGNYATRDLQYNIRADRYMAEGIYRHYVRESEPRLVRSVTICFLEPRADEPLIIVAQIKYVGEADLKVLCKEWDPWDAYFKWAQEPALGQIIRLESPDPARSVLEARLVAAPLYSVASIDDVEKMMHSVSA